MLEVTIIGAGAYSKLIHAKYRLYPGVRVKAVVSPRPFDPTVFGNVLWFPSFRDWVSSIGTPKSNDLFEIAVHYNVLHQVFCELVEHGASNVVLPKPIALRDWEIEEYSVLARARNVSVFVASQWHYSALIALVADYIHKNRASISEVQLVFSRMFDDVRLTKYTATTAFVPHVIQILHSLGLLEPSSCLDVGYSTEHKVCFNIQGIINVHAESNIMGPERESLAIYQKGQTLPALTADLRGERAGGGFVKFPHICVGGKIVEVREDLLQKMLGHVVSRWKGGVAAGGALTLDKYVPVARHVVRLNASKRVDVCVIGAGVFGTVAALEIARKGYSVLLLEKSEQLLTGASLVNQCRVHMGYHYPRDEQTARESLTSIPHYEKYFGPTVVRQVDNFYLVAEQGSLTTADEFVGFCQRLGLPYEMSWPHGIEFRREKIALSVKVPEKIFDANRKRKMLMGWIARQSNLNLLSGAQVVQVEGKCGRYSLEFIQHGTRARVESAAVVNATYGCANSINRMLGIDTPELQYELCEVPIVSSNWKSVGCSVIDGPFFGVMPFGYSNDHLLYDVELSVLERCVGSFPTFEPNVYQYNQNSRPERRLVDYLNKWKEWIHQIGKVEHKGSMYTTRVVLPRVDKTDARPTLLKYERPGYWQIFSGKVACSVPTAIRIAGEIDDYMQMIR